MGEKKIKYTKDWLVESSGSFRSRKTHKFEQMKVMRSEDLPEPISQTECAALMKKHYQTIKSLRLEGKIRFQKVGGRWMTTPEWIAEYYKKEWAK